MYELWETKHSRAVAFTGRAQGSGAAFERTLWLAHEWRDNKTVWWHAFESEQRSPPQE